MWWGDVEGGKAINSVRFTSQSFSEPVPLDYELHKCFSVPNSNPLVGQDGYSVMKLGISLPPGQLSSDLTPPRSLASC